MTYDASTIKTAGYWILSLGIFGMVMYAYRVFSYSFPLDMGIVTSTSAMTLLGLVSIWTGGCLKRLEAQLDFERGRAKLAASSK